MVIRPAERSDIPLLVRFQLEMARETEGLNLDSGVLERGVRGVFEDPSRGRYLIAEVNGEAAGSLMLTSEWSDWRAGTVLWIQSVWVSPEARRQGVYRGLYDHVRREAEKDPSIRGIRLYVDHRNTRAQQVYTNLGMNGEHYRVFEWMKD